MNATSSKRRITAVNGVTSRLVPCQPKIGVMGRLNQTAYNFFLFLRDVCDGDGVGRIDGRSAAADRLGPVNRVAIAGKPCSKR